MLSEVNSAGMQSGIQQPIPLPNVPLDSSRFSEVFCEQKEQLPNFPWKTRSVSEKPEMDCVVFVHAEFL